MNYISRLALGALIVVAGTSAGCTGDVATESEAPATVSAPAPAAATPTCPIDATWVQKPSLPSEVDTRGETQDLCDFYRFSWQSFLYLASPTSSSADSVRNFQDHQAYPVLQLSGDSCAAAQPAAAQLFVSAGKEMAADGPFTIPERINQARDEDVIYDQPTAPATEGNAVYYDIRFSRSTLCPKPPASGDLPAGTIEMKTAWRDISALPASEQEKYFTMDTVITGVTKQAVTLGLIGFHLAQSTPEHPEMVWATFEHKANAPDCISPSATTGWSFTSGVCAACLEPSAKSRPECSSCAWNEGVAGTSLTGTPTEICRVFPDGTHAGDDQAGSNVAFIDSTNQQLVEPGGYLTLPSAPAGMSVWQNYFLVGGIWLNQDDSPSSSSDIADQRGSIQLANTVMETGFQGTYTWANSGGSVEPENTNCFLCHIYTKGSTATYGLSHIVDNISGGAAGSGAQ